MATSKPALSLATALEAGPAEDVVSPLRDASRKLVRQWEFLRPTPSGFTLSPAAMHCLIEIGDHGRHGFPELCGELNLTPSQLGCTLMELISSGNVKRESHPTGNSLRATTQQEEERYFLTPVGTKTLDEINTYAQKQVTLALAATPLGTAAADITAAFRAYAAALERTRLVETNPTPARTPEPTTSSPLPLPPPQRTVTIVPGYRPGILGRTLEMHLDYYPPITGWGREFEASLAKDIGDLLTRLDRPANQVWSAVLATPSERDPQVPPVERIIGVVYVDGECVGEEGVARLRCFIVDDSTRGLGAGGKLLAAAMGFVREMGFRECQLSMIPSATVAKKMYEKVGFKEAGGRWVDAFGKGFMSMDFVWRRDGGT
ncbi:hypothetical protein MFIFM68171_01352 [Madurella fahalii]|uniref:N-acetyltransferase domain-containing protein n=1 Tax=Madurella fahalii TaxID=1157608 RepID=A0ABQ0G070_9PEZI